MESSLSNLFGRLHMAIRVKFLRRDTDLVSDLTIRCVLPRLCRLIPDSWIQLSILVSMQRWKTGFNTESFPPVLFWTRKSIPLCSHSATSCALKDDFIMGTDFTIM